MDFLQIFLFVNVFIVGAVIALAVQHAYAHFKPHTVEKPHPANDTAKLSPAMREHLIDQAKTNFQAVLNRSATDFGHELQATSAELNKTLEKLGTEIINDEMKRYHANLDQLRSAAETTISSAQNDISQHQTDLKAKLAEEIAAEKEQLIKQIDTKLADAVMSFLMETLQHNVDLGAQSAYLTALLEEHKSEFTKGISNEA
jgi:Skp family chaperone for outer membrane proteins